MMKKILGLCCGIVAASTLVSAQTPSSQPQTSQPTTSSSTASTSRQSAQPMTIVGCVTPDTSDPNATSSSSRRFVLSNIQPSGTSGQSRSSATSYLLVPGADANLSEHLNHKVQITGTIDSSSSMSSSSTSSPSSSSSSPSSSSPSSSSPSSSSSSASSSSTQSSSSAMPSFRVTSVKMLSETCP
jgi:hypothetical protein